MSPHTPGPWMYRGPGSVGGPCIWARDKHDHESVIATVHTTGVWLDDIRKFADLQPQADANARLIAKAWLIPELVAALQAVLDEPNDRAWEAARDVVRKARGQ